MRVNQPVTGRNLELPPDANILSTTTPDSHITYVNPDFIKISGFTKDELVGQPHNIVRHPDMPPMAFQHMWQTLKGGRSWMGLVKNRCKNGDHYWVSAYATPIAKDGRTVEYQSVRTKPAPGQIDAAEKLYASIRNGKTPLAWRLPRLDVRLKVSLLSTLSLIPVLLFLSHLLPISVADTAIMGVSLGLLNVLFIYLWLSPLHKLVKKARTICDNPLSQVLYTGRHDEFGEIEFAMAMAQAETTAVIGRMANAANQLEALTEELVSEIEDCNNKTNGQQSETDQVAAAINEMTATIQQVAATTQEAASAADHADKETSQGQELVTSTKRIISSLADEIHQAAEVIHDLDKHSKEISTVLNAIQDIAEQTNLLALNAAIEAARAGEMGRGFAVVADEVRQLASRTQQSTTDTQKMINSLQDGARSAVAAMEKSREKANHSVDHAHQAAEKLTAIGRRVNQISDISTQIASAVEQQGAVSEGINNSIVTIRDAASANATVGQYNRKRAEDVAQLTSALQELAKQFWSKRSQS
ncbi:PAS domain S-box protein [Hahella sp. KA22]|uniref:methyl-accepting chemotaxis protein n=1 Tax=Hahella sp. KA22 TaxID=1628392 RepID=UPI000FDF565C|nr:PAS domain-containing methyl-accepting chemotaxis protein [Hahella sp. KA22]AZZ92565.1 PAS domain S-box protein [Hahella sp. KA22]QAY55938.1 PAS domain S-box protein [Hahella sp. KA22]